MLVFGFPSTTPAGTTHAVTVAAVNPNGDVDAGYTGTIHFTSSDPSPVLPPDYTFAAADLGQHTFSVNLRTPGTQSVTAQDTVNAGIHGTDGNIVVTGLLGDHLLLLAPPASTSAGTALNAPNGVQVAVVDVNGQVVPLDASNVTVSVTGPGAFTPASTTTVAAKNGIASFTNLSLLKSGTYTLTATDGQLKPATSANFTISPAAAASFLVSTPGSSLVGQSFNFTVTAQDPFGNPATGYAGTVKFSSSGGNLDQLPAGTKLVSGTGTFSATLNQRGLDRLSATDSVDATITGSAGVTITAVVPSKLILVTPPPATVVVGSPFGATLAAEDASGNVDSTFTGAVTVNLQNGPGGGVLLGTTTVNAVKGVATFTNLSVTAAGTYTLIFSASGLTVASATVVASGQVLVVPSQLVLTTPPPASIAVGTGFGLAVTAEDAAGHLASSFTAAVSVAILSGPSGVPLGGTTTVNPANGVATFAGLTLSVPGTYTLLISGGGLSTTSTAVTVTQTSVIPTQLVLVTAPPSSVAPGSAFSLSAAAENAAGVVATGFTGAVTVGISSGPPERAWAVRPRCWP